ncbi:MAG TPA: cyclopropane-fatty-acyl-phospholipid synthase family protein [Caulobacteraceae bacterium]|nr:cyclopropane-fatty-acyl-phospholipid synthase family protein [Caulobacteraceae bacterium]
MLHGLLKRMIRVGDLQVRLPNGRVDTYGDGTGPRVEVRLTSRAVRAIAADPTVGVGESYMNGDLEFEAGDIWTLLELGGRNNAPSGRRSLAGRLLNFARRRIDQWNDRNASRRNVHHHYDLSYDLYRRFLDRDMQYSCAYWPSLDITLEEAQAAKKAHITAKLKLEPGMKVLDIGCGWGGLALELGARYGVEVLGVTLSEEQLAIAQRRAEEAGLQDRVRFSLTDFRDVRGPFDRIVSVGMFEHVGAPNHLEFFRDVHRLLTDDGIALIHSIGRSTPPSVTNAFIRKYIFPGGYIPALSETMAAVEEAGLWATDIEILRLHYAETLKQWRLRFWAQREEIVRLYDERFCRMWGYYLASSEYGFRYGDNMNFQLQLTKRVGAAPMTRDYMLDDERLGPVAARRQIQAAE